MGRGAITLGSALVLWIGGVATDAALAAPPPPTPPSISLHASHSRITGSKPVSLWGKVSGKAGSVQVDLYTNPYPYQRARLVGSTTTRSNGSYSFTVRPDRNTRYRVNIHGSAIQAVTQIGVIAPVVFRQRALTLGRARVVTVVTHPADLRWWYPAAHWWFSGPHGHFWRGPTTHGRRLTKTKLLLAVRTALPAGPYRWRVCFHPVHSRALTVRHPAPGCTGQAYHGRGWLPYGFPGPVRIARAQRYLASRGGHTALAVVDTEGRMSGAHINDQFITGSVVKAMLLVAYLRRLDGMGQHHVDSNSNSILYPMIHVSDNNAATRCWDIVGNSGLYALAQAAGMTHFSMGSPYGSEWGAALLTAHDQAKFFFEMDSLIPREFVGYARYLLSTIASYESWGIPAVARPLGYHVFFKAGWRPSPDIYLVHQIARLEKGRRKFSIAIMTDGDPDMGYGISTIEGTAGALLR